MNYKQKAKNKKISFALLFDMDGVLVDNSKYHFRSWQVVAKELGFKLTEDFYHKKLNGRVAKDILKIVTKRELPEAEVKRLTNEKEKIYRHQYAPVMRPVKGLLKFLEAMQRAGVKMALATSAPVVNVKFVLSHTKTHKFFKKIVNASHVTNGKPHPEVYLKAAKQIGVKPKNCIVFEDALNGIEAGQRARMKVVAVATTNKAKDLQHADMVVKDFTRINIEKLKKLFK